MRTVFSSLCILAASMLADFGVLAAPFTATPYMMDKDAVLNTVTGPNRFEVIGALGIATLRANNSSLGVTSSETDKLLQTNKNNWNTFAAQAGVGYIYYRSGVVEYFEQPQWFPSIEPELNAYYLGRTNITGDVWRFSDPNFNEMTYTMPIQSTRLMLDGALTIVSKKQRSLYVIGGIGDAWNRVGYRDAAIDNTLCVDEQLHLNTATRSSFAWEIGAGIQYAFSHRVALSLEYLYADLGTAKSSSHGNTGTITTPVVVPARFELTSQSALLGLHITL